MKRALVGLMLLLLAVNTSGCLYLLAGAAGGAGTAAWLSGKLSEEVNVSLERGFQAAKSALKAFNYSIEKETKKDEVAQLIGKYADDRQIWIDVHRLTDVRSRISVRVGATGDKEASRKILERIKRYL